MRIDQTSKPIALASAYQASTGATLSLDDFAKDVACAVGAGGYLRVDAPDRSLRVDCGVR